MVVLHLGGQGKHRAQLHGGAVVRLFAQVGCGKRHAIPFVRPGDSPSLSSPLAHGDTLIENVAIIHPAAGAKRLLEAGRSAAPCRGNVMEGRRLLSNQRAQMFHVKHLRIRPLPAFRAPCARLCSPRLASRSRPRVPSLPPARPFAPARASLRSRPRTDVSRETSVRVEAGCRMVPVPAGSRDGSSPHGRDRALCTILRHRRFFRPGLSFFAFEDEPR